MTTKATTQKTQEEKDLIEDRYKSIYSTDQYKRLWDRRDAERFYLKDEKYIDIHLLTGEILVCELIEWATYAVVVNFADKKGRIIKTLIPKHSIKFVVIKQQEIA